MSAFDALMPMHAQLLDTPMNNRGRNSYQLNRSVLDRIWLERLRQQDLFRRKQLAFECSSPIVSHDRKLRVATEELGEVAEAIDRIEQSESKLSKAHSTDHLIVELTQLAAVTIAWLESLEKEQR